MTLRQLINDTPVKFLDTSLRDLHQILLLVEDVNGKVTPLNFCPDGEHESARHLCQFFIDNCGDFDRLPPIKIATPANDN